MWEAWRHAWSGWQGFIDGGKLAALFLAAEGYLLWNGRRRGPGRRLAVYGGIAGLLCIVPVTAALLMEYQTSFYDYPWIWSIVPFTALIALGGTVFLTERWKTGTGYRSFVYNGVLTLLCVGALVLCGSLGGRPKDTPLYVFDGSGETIWRREDADAVLEELTRLYAKEEDGGRQGFCLWAPREILEYARSERGDIRLLYGRNMWDLSLNAYSYDTCSQDRQKLYDWMEHLTDYQRNVGEAEGIEYVGMAFSLGADCVLLPGSMQGWNPKETDWGQYNVEVTDLGQYYLLRQG